MTLIKYRDSGMHTYTYFWTDKNNRVVSPYFDSEYEAQQWMEKRSEENIRNSGDSRSS